MTPVAEVCHLFIRIAAAITACWRNRVEAGTDTDTAHILVCVYPLPDQGDVW